MINPRLLLVAIIWGINYPVVKLALSDFLPMSFTVVRFFLASFFLISFMMLSQEPLSIDRRDRPAFIKLGVLGITLYNLFFMYGLKYTTASNSALFISTSSLFAVFIQAASGRERVTARIVTGIVLASVGVIFIIRGHGGDLTFSSSGLFGDLLTLVAAVLWALYTITAQPLLEKYSAVKVTAYSMTAGSILLLPIGLYELVRQSWTGISFQSWFALGFAAFFSAGVAFTLWYQGVKRIGVTRTIVYQYLVPCVAVIVAVFFLGEQISMLQLLGGIAILVGVFLAQSKS